MNYYKYIDNNQIRLELTISIKEQDYYFKAYRKSDNCYIGNCGIRLEKNEANYYLGNIEYEVFEQYRGNNYAEKFAKLLTTIAVDRKIDNLYITANPKNIASIKTITNLGGSFIEIVKVPKKMKLYKNGIKTVSVYNISLKESRK